MSDKEVKEEKKKISVFTVLQYGTTAAAVLFIMRSTNRVLTPVQRGKAILGGAACVYLSVANEFGMFPFSFFVKEKVPLQKT